MADNPWPVLWRSNNAQGSFGCVLDSWEPNCEHESKPCTALPVWSCCVIAKCYPSCRNPPRCVATQGTWFPGLAFLRMCTEFWVCFWSVVFMEKQRTSQGTSIWLEVDLFCFLLFAFCECWDNALVKHFSYGELEGPFADRHLSEHIF